MKKKLIRLNIFFRKYMTLWVFLSIFLGLVLGYTFRLKLNFLILPLVFLMIYVMIVPTPFSLFARVFMSPKEIVLGLVNILIVAPLVAFAISSALLANNFTTAGFTLAGAVPPGGMNAAWTGLLGGNVPLAIVLQAITLIISVVQVPYTLKILVGTYVSVPVNLLMRSLAVLVFLPLTAGFLTREIAIRGGKENLIEDLRPLFPVLSGLAALAVVFIAASLQAKKIVSNPAFISHTVVVALLYYATLFVTGTVISRLAKLNYENAIPVVYGGATKNLSIAIALAVSAFHNSGVILAIIACFMVQMPMASVFFRIVPKILAAKDRQQDL